MTNSFQSKFFIAISIFIIIFGSMTMIKADANEDGLESTAALNIGRWAENTITNQNNEVFDKIGNGIETLVKRLAQSMIPYFAIFFLTLHCTLHSLSFPSSTASTSSE